MKDYYQVLGISRDATSDEIRAGFTRLSKMYHPDTFQKVTINLNEEQLKAFQAQLAHFKEKFLEINEAYEVLSNPKKRAEYDKQVVGEKHMDFRLPIVEISPSILGFGSLDVGTVVSNFFVVNFIGKASEIDFATYPENIFRIGNLRSINDATKNQTFPIEVEVIADTKQLTFGKTYEGVVTINIDGNEAKVDLILKTSVQMQRTTPRPRDIVSTVPFWFAEKENGKARVATSPEELVPLCDEDWEEAIEYFSNDRHFNAWFKERHENHLSRILERCRTEWHNRNIGLEMFLRKIDPTLSSPTIEIDVANSKMGNYDFSSYEHPETIIKINNNGRGCCFGRISSDNEDWIEISKPEFAVPPKQTHEVKVIPKKHVLLWETPYKAKVTIANNSQNFGLYATEIELSTPINPKIEEITILNNQGKWRIAEEKLTRIDKDKRTPQKRISDTSKAIARKKIEMFSKAMFGASFINGCLGAIVGSIGIKQIYNHQTTILFFLGMILGALSVGYFLKTSGGIKGTFEDYKVSISNSLVITIQAMVLAVAFFVLTGL